MKAQFSIADPEYSSLSEIISRQLGKPAVLTISPADNLYVLSEGAAESRTHSLMSYFRSGIQIKDAVEQVANWYFGPKLEGIRLLDFASGYGRSTRFLAARFGPSQIWACDPSPEALQFQSSEIGVNAIPFAENSAAFRPSLQWDCIFANFFFNGLSEIEFTRWLWRLYSLLSPGGLLMFSAGCGNSSVSLGFIHQAIIAVTGGVDHIRVPQGLCFTYDLFALGKSKLPHPFEFQCGPNGCVDFCRWTEPEQMKVTGWAYEPTPGHSIARVDLYYNGALRGSCVLNHDRHDIAASMGKPEEPAAIRCGWDCIVNLTGEKLRPSDDWLVAKAISTSGREFVLLLDHPTNIDEFEAWNGWTYNEALGKSQAILPVLRFIDLPINGHFTSPDPTFSGWIATPNYLDLEELALVGRFGNVPYLIVERPDVFAEQQMPALGFSTHLPPEYLTVWDPQLRFVNPSGVVVCTLETVVDFIARN